MRLEERLGAIAFLSQSGMAGAYVTNDPFKPYLHPLMTPKGHAVSLAVPHDHRHHKGLMYALRGTEVNFWEETPGPDGDRPGRQRHDRFSSMQDSGEVVGLDEDLTWLDSRDDTELLYERRTITCRETADGSGFDWTWSTNLTAVHEMQFVMSQWSSPDLDGAMVNYHGLGIRFRRDFGCTGGNQLWLDGDKTGFAAGMGRNAKTIAFDGSIDGYWPPPRARVEFRHDGANALFILQQPFAFMSLGPTNRKPLRLAAGQQMTEHYAFTVSDLLLSEAKG